MLIHGIIEVNDLDAKSGKQKCRPLRSYIYSKIIKDTCYGLRIRNSEYYFNYLVSDLDKVDTKKAAKGKLCLLFKRPKHRVQLQADDANMLNLFLHQLKYFVSNIKKVTRDRQGLKTILAQKDRFSPAPTEYVAINHFDQRILSLMNLNKLVLENCVLPNLPEQIGHLPLAFLSLSYSELGASQYERDTLWDWMTVNTIQDTLKILHMDSISLRRLPFEILFLKNLETLSVSANDLMYLPQNIGDLKKLRTLLVADNYLSYLPHSLMNRIFINLNLSYNDCLSQRIYHNHISMYMDSVNENERLGIENQTVQSLSHLSFSSVVDNCIKFKRQELPRSLWHNFDIFGRCVLCGKVMSPHYCDLYIIRKDPFSENFLKYDDPLSCVNYLIVRCTNCSFLM